jgi:biopolymer transport protein TolR
MIFKTKYSSLYDNRHENKVIETINVTPFIDVMLVLLVVFMISAPLLMGGVNVNLPDNDSAQDITAQNPFAITIDKNKNIFYEDKEISKNQIANFLQKNLLSKNTIIYLKADSALTYGYIMSIIKEFNKEGYNKVSLVTENS